MVEGVGLVAVDWSLPAGVQAFVTTRQGGCSLPPRESFNLGLHTGDEPASVQGNRLLLHRLLEQRTGLKSLELQWMQQVHGTEVCHARALLHPPPVADAIHTDIPALVLGVLTADCLPVLFCSDDGSEIAAAHAGWRGLLGGVLEAAVAAFRSPPGKVRAWLGPAIGPCHFEVGQEVRTAFLAAAAPADRELTARAFAPAGLPDKWLADLYALARIRLLRAGLGSIAGDKVCTICNHDRFYSYRLQPVTGRFATLVVKTV